MQWRVVKQWAGLPVTAQPATQELFPSSEAAEQKAEELRPLFPGREFRVVPARRKCLDSSR